MAIPPHVRVTMAKEQAAGAVAADTTERQENTASKDAFAELSKYAAKQLPNSAMGGRPPKVTVAPRKKWVCAPLKSSAEPRPETLAIQEVAQAKSSDEITSASEIQGPAELLKSRWATAPIPPEQTPTEMEGPVELLKSRWAVPDPQEQTPTESSKKTVRTFEMEAWVEFFDASQDKIDTTSDESLVRAFAEKATIQSTKSVPARDQAPLPVPTAFVATPSSPIDDRKPETVFSTKQVPSGNASTKRANILASAPAMILCNGRCGKTKPKHQFPLAQVAVFLDPTRSETIRCTVCSMPETINGWREEVKQAEDEEFQMVELESEDEEDDEFDMCD